MQANRGGGFQLSQRSGRNAKSQEESQGETEEESQGETEKESQSEEDGEAVATMTVERNSKDMTP